MAMKRYIFTLALGVVLSFTQCTMNDIDVNVTPSANSGLHIIGAAADFDNHNVGTRAAEDAYPDSFISEMTMFVFDINGDLLQGLDANQNPISSAINIPQSNPTFLIEAKKYNGTGIISSMGASLNIKYFRNTGTDLSACSIYIVANAYHQISHLIDSDDSNGEIKTLADLKAAVLDIDATLSMPKDENGDHIGFPMIGHAVTPDDQVATFDLRYGTNTETNAVANIPLIKLYSKVYFAIQINSNQIVANGPTPKFTIDRAEVFNVPTKACMGAYSNDYINKLGNEYQFTSDPFVIKSSDCTNKTIYHTTSSDISIGLGSSDLIEFYFYMPEHKVTPNDINPYPANIPSNLKQYYKPKLVGAGSDGSGLAVGAKTATFVRIYGSYTDHNGRIKGVSYDVYLGQNETNDFEVKRNQQLINYLTITGTTNHKDAYGENQTNISVDHRVTMTDRGYNVYMEREAILDAHFEVRPVDFELQNGSSLTITIPADCSSWISMESDDAARSGVNSNLYIDNTNVKRGVRKYFTTNLVSELNGNLTKESDGRHSLTIKHSSCYGGANPDPEFFRIWFYVDENPNVYDKTGTGKQTSESGNYTVSKTLYRNAPVKLYYSNTATDNPNIDKEAVHTINFQQWNLWRVWSSDKTRFYDIEHEEEYLNNYASNAGYGTPQDGMSYGLEGVQLSNGVLAYWAERQTHKSGSFFGIDIVKWIVELLDDMLGVSSAANSIFANSEQVPYYDFYMSRDDFPIDKMGDDVVVANYRRDYQGIEFNKEIAATLKANSDNPKAKIDGIILTEAPKSAFAYCYNKNKRKGDGTIDINNIKWFLPAIDEIEDIALGAYDEFDRVFQNEKYWSCQPAYNYNSVVIKPFRWRSSGIFGGGSYSDLSEYVTMDGEFYSDNLDRARATSIYTKDGTNYTNIQSGLPDGVVSGKFTANAFGNGGDKNNTIEPNYNSNNINYNADIYTTGEYRGNSPRSEVNRIRAVYRSGTK